MSPQGSLARLPEHGVVVPVKPLAVAKSRLAPLGDDLRRELMLAFAIDTVTAALDCRVVARVLVVTDDVVLARGLQDLGVRAIPDGDTTDLNTSLVQGAAELVRSAPGLRPVALCGDLPCLRGDDLGEVLIAGRREDSAFVADAAGTGTTLYTAATLETFTPRFGHASRTAHLETGATELDASRSPSVRRDVDTPLDLEDALALGVGPRTAWVAERAGLR